MKRLIFIMGVLFLMTVTLLAQNPEWNWAVAFGGDGVDFGRGVCSDNAGNTYVTGYFSGTVTFGSQTLMSSGDADIFVSKFDINGNWVWTAQAGGTEEDQGSGINLDSTGNVYVTGRFMNTVIFGSTQITSNGDADVFLAKLDPDGNWEWVVQGGGTGFDWATYSLGIDQNDNIIITGGYRNSATFGSTTFTTSDGSDDIFVASLDTDGNWQWVVNAAGNGWDYGCAIATLPDGTSFITGGFTDDLTIGSTALSTFSTPDIYVAKIDSNGNWQWAVQAGDNTYFPDFGQSIGVDPAGNAYIGGYFMGTAEFGSITLNSPGNPNCDIFVAKIDSNGNWQWATMAGSDGDDMINGVGVDAEGNTYTTGGFSNTADFGNVSITSSGAHDIFGAMIDANGTWQWAERAGGVGDDVGYGLGMGNNGIAIITGEIEDTAEVGNFNFISNGEEDALIAKIGIPNNFDPPENVAIDPVIAELSWTPPAAVISEDNFDSYTPGDYLAVVNPTLWTTWSNAPGGSEDAVISDAQSNSPSNSILVELNNDLVMIMNDYTSGVYSFDLDMYVPTGYCGYYNLQKTSVPGTEWAFQVYFMTDGTASADAGAEAAAVFNYPHDQWMNCKVIVDLNNDWADFYVDGDLKVGWQWTLGTFGTAGLLQFGGVNIFGGANSATTDTPMFYVDNVELKEIVPATDALTGYNVYLDQTFLTYTTDLSCILTDYATLSAGTEYDAGVSAVYDDPGESDVVELTFIYDPQTNFDPPNNVVAEVQDYNEVLVTWELPGAPSEEIYYHSGYDNNGIGTGAAVDFICAARFTADELATYYGGWEISGVNVFLHSMDFTYIGIQVYEGGSYGDPGTLVYDQDVTSSAVAGAFTNHQLSTPVPLVSGNEYWIGYDISATADHPAAVDIGPMVPDKGAWMYFSGAWSTLPELGATLDFNWVINGVVTQSDAIAGIGKSEVIGAHKAENIQSTRRSHFSYGEMEAEFNRPISRRNANNVVNYNSRALAGYKVYRDGSMIHEITNPATLEYLDDAGLDAGNYDYYVTALYTAPVGESDPSNTENVTITLPSPTGVAATSNWPNILVQWSAPTDRALLSYNVYQDGTFVTNTTSTFYLHANVPEGDYTYTVAAVYTGDYEGDLSDGAYVEHHPDGSGVTVIPLVTSLEGNYPNPFNPTTTIKFGLNQDENVDLVIYNIRGEKVRTLVSGELEAGYHSILWNGKDDSNKTTSSGVYFYKMKAGKYQSTKKMILIK